MSNGSRNGQLATSLAHELNQPLTAIANYVETARDMLEKNAANIATVRQSVELPVFG